MEWQSLFVIYRLSWWSEDVYKRQTGHIVIAIQSSLKGLRKLLLNEPAIYRDLENCWSVVAEAIQTILRREAYPHPYEALKALTYKVPYSAEV